MLGASLGLFKASCCLLGPFLGRSWAPFSPLGGSLGRPAASWAFPGRSWGPVRGSPGGPFGAFWASWRLPRPPREPRRQEKAPKPRKNTKSIIKYVVLFKNLAFSLGFYEAPGVYFSRFSNPRKLKNHVFYEGFKVFAVSRAGPKNGRKKLQKEPQDAPRQAQNLPREKTESGVRKSCWCIGWPPRLPRLSGGPTVNLARFPCSGAPAEKVHLSRCPWCLVVSW